MYEGDWDLRFYAVLYLQAVTVLLLFHTSELTFQIKCFSFLSYNILAIKI